jgi:hypothetical protein
MACDWSKLTAIRRKRRGPMTGAELMRQLAADPDYQQRMAIADARRQVRAEESRRAEQPILADLRGVGYDVDSVWHFVNTSTPYPSALRVLLHHLVKGGYPADGMDGLARAVAVRPMAPAWETLRRPYLKAEATSETEGLAVPLTASATPDRLDALPALLAEQSRGESRIHFLRAIRRVGGSRGWEVITGFVDDPVFGKEASHMVKQRQRSSGRRSSRDKPGR